jgi:hypothetical protein
MLNFEDRLTLYYSFQTTNILAVHQFNFNLDSISQHISCNIPVAEPVEAKAKKLRLKLETVTA